MYARLKEKEGRGLHHRACFRGSDMRVTEHNPKTYLLLPTEYPISPATTGCTRDRLSHPGSLSAKYRQLLVLQCHKLAISL